MFLPFICLSAVNIVCWRFLAFACASGCFVAWRLVLRWYVSFMPLFARFVRGFVGLLLLSVILLLSGGRRLCVCCVRRFLRFVRLFLTAVCVFQRFCVNWCFSCCFPTFVWFFNSCLFFFCFHHSSPLSLSAKSNLDRDGYFFSSALICDIYAVTLAVGNSSGSSSENCPSQ